MLNNFYAEDLVLLDIEVKEKKDLFEIISKKIKELGVTDDENGVVEDFMKKDKNTVTYLGNEYAIPHIRSSRINSNIILFIRMTNSISWSDDDRARYIFSIIIKEEDRNTHIEALKRISKKVLDKKSSDIFKNSKDKEEILSIIKS
ncbi:MAG: PTS sugar transporter subunit IIA [Oceanivirga sp.]|nr:PTS sugar transporter subunit IIA [Oceanivirga sp.]